MKKILAIIGLVVCTQTVSARQTLSLHTMQVAPDSILATPVREVENIDGGVRVTYHFNYVYVDSTITDGRVTYTYSFENFGLTHEAGIPSLPGRTDAIALTNINDVTVELEHMEYVTLNRELTPATPPTALSAVISAEETLPISTTGVFPEQPIRLVDVQTLRGTPVGYVAVNPVSYIHENTTVQLATTLTYIVHNSERGNKNRAIAFSSAETPMNDAIVNSLIINPQDEPSAKPAITDYLIISVPKYKAAIDEFALWKRRLGFRVHISYRDKWDDNTIVNDSIDKYYSTCHNLQYLLLVGGADDVPSNISTIDPYTADEQTYHYADYYYGTPSHNHEIAYVPDIYVGRIPAYKLEDAFGAFHKIIDYEACDMDYDKEIFHRVLHCANFADVEKNSNEAPDGQECRNFVLASEQIINKMAHVDIQSERVYHAEDYDKAKPERYRTGQSLPEELLSNDFNWKGKAYDIQDVLDKGVMYVLYRGHGSAIGWEYPQYTIANIAREDRGFYSSEKGRKSWLHPIFYSLTCLTGNYIQPECFATVAMTNPNGGASGVFAASDVSFDPYGTDMLNGMVEAFIPHYARVGCLYVLQPSQYTRMGEIMNMGLNKMVQESGFIDLRMAMRLQYQYEIYHCVGDPSMCIRTMEPHKANAYVTFDENGKCHVDELRSDHFISFYDGISGQTECYYGHSADFQFANPIDADYFSEIIQNQSVAIYQTTNSIPQIVYRSNPNYMGNLPKIENIYLDGRMMHIKYANNPNTEKLIVNITAVSPQLVYSYRCDTSKDEITIDTSQWPPALYLVYLMADGVHKDTHHIMITN